MANNEEPFYTVERILDKRRDQTGRVFCLIQWRCSREQLITWVPEENLVEYGELMEDYNRRVEQLAKGTATRSKSKESPLLIGFDRGLQPQKIIEGTRYGEELGFLMKWKGSNVSDIVTAREANLRCPQVVIKFYESKIRFTREEEETDMANENLDEQEPTTSACMRL